jgi:hypothetical protein
VPPAGVVLDKGKIAFGHAYLPNPSGLSAVAIENPLRRGGQLAQPLVAYLHLQQYREGIIQTWRIPVGAGDLAGC